MVGKEAEEDEDADDDDDDDKEEEEGEEEEEEEVTTGKMGTKLVALALARSSSWWLTMPWKAPDHEEILVGKW